MSLKKGIYQHFKGNFYQVLDVARHSETSEEHVVYRTLYDDPATGNSSLWVRPLTMFDETIERDGGTLKRFAYVGESMSEVDQDSRGDSAGGST